ncbi:MAG: methyltransferase regulatory domain-containing protein [Burkholderiaceae bacterium]|nr:methyltransferase regulatory domain-containing protein [Burkholderiaceae bacterium]
MLTATPGLEQAFAELATKTPAYVLHEFLNDSWQPMSFAEISAELLPAKLAFAASSDLHFRHHDIHFTRPQQDELARIEAGVLRETTRDVLLGRRFRREYWVRGARPLSRAEVAQRLRELRVVAAMPLQHVPGRVEGTVGTAVPAAERVAALFEWVEGAGGVVEVGLLLDNAQQRGWNPNELLELLATLVGMRAFYPAAPEAQAQGARPSALRLNAYLSAPHASRTELLHLASPVTGGGVAAPLALQMMLAARRQAPENPQAWAGQVWDAMQAEGQQMMKGQQRVTDRTTALATLQPLVRQMQEQSLPLLRRLGVVD